MDRVACCLLFVIPLYCNNLLSQNSKVYNINFAYPLDLLSELLMDYGLPSSPTTTVTSDPKGLHHRLALLPEVGGALRLE